MRPLLMVGIALAISCTGTTLAATTEGPLLASPTDGSAEAATPCVYVTPDNPTEPVYVRDC